MKLTGILMFTFNVFYQEPSKNVIRHIFVLITNCYKRYLNLHCHVVYLILDYFEVNLVNSSI